MSANLQNDQMLSVSDAKLRANLDIYCQNLVKVKHSQQSSEQEDGKYNSGELVPFIWNEEQRYVHQQIESQKERTGQVRALILKPRKRGISTYVGARYYHKTTFNEGQKTFILTHEDDATQNLFDMTKRVHDHMAPEYRPTSTQDSVSSLTFGRLDSKYGLGTARTKARGRSDTINNFHGSEVAFWPNADVHAEGIIKAVPKDRGNEVIMETTANGPMGWFYHQWLLAEAGKSDYIAIFFPWFWAKNLRRPVPKGFRPTDDELEYAETYGLDPEQVAWMHYENIDLLPPGADIERICWKFRQENPATAEEAFQLSGDESLIRSELAYKARKLDMEPNDFDSIILGLDTARGGNDNTRLIDRRGRVAGHHVNIKFDEPNEMVIADNIALVVNHLRKAGYKVKRVYIDITSAGKGVHDRLHQMGYGDIVVGVGFGNKATDKVAYANKRAEIWGRMAAWFGQDGGVSIPDDDELHRHVCSAGYSYTIKDQLILEKKEKIKERLGFSPDGGDALALTFTEENYEARPDDTPDWAKKLKSQREGSWMSR